MSQLKRRKTTKTRLALFGLAFASVIAAFLWFMERKSPEDQAQSYYAHGVELAERHDYAKASVELRNALRKKNDMLAAWVALSKVEEATQNWSDLIRSLQSVVSLAPNDIEARVKLVKLLALGDRAYQALDLLNTDGEANSQNGIILGLKAAILYKLNDRPGALRQARQALDVDPGNVDALAVLANERMANGDEKGALQILETDAATSRNDIGIQLLKLKIFEQLGQSQKFESLLRQLAESHRKESLFRKQLIKFYLDNNRIDDAEKEARALVQENPTNPEAELDLVRLLYAVKGATAARQELDTRISAGGDVFPYQIAVADFDFAQGKFADAEQRIQKVLNTPISNEQSLAAEVKLAEMNFKRSKIDAAEAIVSGVLRKDGRNTDALKVQASIRIVRGQFDLAITDLQQALTDRPRSTELLLLLALAQERGGSMALAAKQYTDAVRISNFDSAVGLSYVNFLLRRGNVDRAEQFLTELSKRSPENLDILSALAQVELTRKDWAGAQTVAESIRNVSAGRGIADQVLGAALLGQQKYDESIAIFQSAVSASPSAVQPMIFLVQALVRAQKTDEAMKFLKSTLETNPDNAEARVLLGSVQLSTGARDQAFDNFKLAIEKQPKNVAGYEALANLYGSEKAFDKAILVIRSGLEMQPDSIVLQLAMAGALEQTQQYDAAIAEYERILGRQPGSMIVANNLASLLSEHRDDKASLARAQTLMAGLRDTQVPQFKDTLGWISYRRDDYLSAVTLLEKAVAGLPDNALVRYHLGMGYIAVGQTAKASEQLTAALSLAQPAELKGKIQQAMRKLQNM